MTRERYFEDYISGRVEELGSVRIAEEEILAFGREFDPQPFHTDPDAAATSVFGRLIASGWHSAAVTMRLLATDYLSPVSSLGSPGVKELRWLKPVYPGDTLSARVTVLETRQSRTRPDRGIVHSFVELLNQDGDVVLDLKAANFIRCREATG